MLLALDIGNSQIYGGIFLGDELKLQFRKDSKNGTTSDELGVFFKSVLRENGMDAAGVKKISVCSVVPNLVHSVRNCCLKYFGLNPFILQAGVKTGLKIRYRNPLEVGADRIANAIAANRLFPRKNLIIIDFGTANTFCAVSSENEYLGGIIFPGLRLSMEALEAKTARLPSVEIAIPQELVARSTAESIQSGLYHGNLCMIRGLTECIKKGYFSRGETVIIGTGGFSRLFEKEKAFDVLIPELVLIGLKWSYEMNV